ncbi:hypothetical protein TNCV_3003781 [Trichonephila clavipes]|nr:hypothetical protein TNCV_3003781 [Trichonephila clavipes]
MINQRDVGHSFESVAQQFGMDKSVISGTSKAFRTTDTAIRMAVTKRVFQEIDCGTSCVTCCVVLLEPQLLDIMIVQFRNEKVSNHGSIPITIDCNVVAFIVFEEGFHQPIKRTKQSVFLDVTVFRHTLVD